MTLSICIIVEQGLDSPKFSHCLTPPWRMGEKALEREGAEQSEKI